MIEFDTDQEMEQNEVNLTPLIDVLFIMLIFFLLTSIFVQKGLNLTLPKTKSAEQRRPGIMEILVTHDNEILFGGEVVAEKDITSRLQILSRPANRPESIVLKSDADARFGLFIKVMDAARSVGLTNLVIATELAQEGDAL